MIKFNRSLIPTPVKRLFDLLGPEKSYAVGGIVRDSILGILPENDGIVHQVAGQDWDLATPLHPKETMSRLRRAGITAVPVGIEHGTVAAVIDSVHYEITTFRYDLEYRDGRHPTVRFTDELEEDLKRRDFTVNALALDIESGDVIDLFDGIGDLREKRIRTVGNPETRFQEDYLRMLRAARFATKLQGTIEAETAQAIRNYAHLILDISQERIREELMKMLGYPVPSQGFTDMHDLGLLFYVLPELDAAFGVGQNRFHADDVARHILYSVDALRSSDPFIRFVTLMHDLGKVPAKQYLDRKEDYVFYGHQYISKGMTKRIMRRLRFSKDETKKACSIVENHMYNLKPDLPESAAKRFIRKLGRENVDGFLRMRMADRKGNRFNPDGYEKGIFNFVRIVRKIDREESALKIRDLHITGHDLIEMGLSPGPLFSDILNQLLEAVMDDPDLNRREWLMERAKGYAEEFLETGTIQFPKRRDTEDDTIDAPSEFTERDF